MDGCVRQTFRGSARSEHQGAEKCESPLTCFLSNIALLNGCSTQSGKYQYDREGTTLDRHIGDGHALGHRSFADDMKVNGDVLVARLGSQRQLKLEQLVIVPVLQLVGEVGRQDLEPRRRPHGAARSSSTNQRSRSPRSWSLIV